MRLFGMVVVEDDVGEEKNEIRVNNLTLINFVLKFTGPTHEQTLTIYLMVIQVCAFYMCDKVGDQFISLQVLGTLFAFSVRYGLASFIYDRVL